MKIFYGSEYTCRAKIEFDAQCEHNEQCQTGKCGATPKRCIKKERGESCLQNSDCVSNRCNFRNRNRVCLE